MPIQDVEEFVRAVVRGVPDKRGVDKITIPKKEMAKLLNNSDFMSKYS
jgi:hypothetical protein